MMIALFVLFVVLALSDWWTTHQILKAGGRELNPVARWLMGKLGVDPALLVSVSFGIIIAGTLLVKGPWWVLAAVDAGYAVVIVNNLLVMRRLKLL